jgi:phosphatidylserine/phosphatidylglycerophosphate/cardiolipin synthase-like enzyme
MPIRRLALASLVSLCAGLAACGGPGSGASEEDLVAGIKEGSDQALAVLALVNDRSVTATELIQQGGVEKRASTNIIAHRDGADTALRTADDDLFDDIAELDAVKLVGPAAVKKLLAYATKKGHLADQQAKELDVIFSPQPAASSHNARVAEIIGAAHESLDVAMYSFSDANISNALGAAVARGVKVRFVFETANGDHLLTGSALEASKSGLLEKKGVDVRYVNKIMHHKFVIADGPRDDAGAAKTATIASGSANWSGSAATKYDENTLFFTGYPELALRLQREFNLMWEHSRDVAVGAAKVFELSTLAIGDTLLPEDPGSHVFFTSANFTVKDTTFSSVGTNEVADAWVRAIQSADESVHIASGHLRSRPVAEALMAKAASSPDVDIRVYLDGQEYISVSASNQQEKELADCLAAAGSSASKIRACNDKGFLYGLEASQNGVDVRYKYYAYRWDASYAAQMHNKYMVIDGDELYTGSYNLSDNAEHATFENMFVFKGPEFAELAASYEERFETLWETHRADDTLAKLTDTIENGATFPLVFEAMSLDWQEVTTLKQKIRANCPMVDSTEFRENPFGHQTCTP